VRKFVFYTNLRIKYRQLMIFIGCESIAPLITVGKQYRIVDQRAERNLVVDYAADNLHSICAIFIKINASCYCMDKRHQTLGQYVCGGALDRLPAFSAQFAITTSMAQDLNENIIFVDYDALIIHCVACFEAEHFCILSVLLHSLVEPSCLSVR
jgi:hypothetical protein